MLTVKHIRFDGAETLDLAERVIFYPCSVADMGNTPTPHAGGIVTVIWPEGHSFDWRTGLIYVMNENGSTVAKYGLGEHDPTYYAPTAGSVPLNA